MSGTGLRLPVGVGPIRRRIGLRLLRAALFLLGEPPRQAWCRDCTPLVDALWEQRLINSTKRYTDARRDIKGDG